MNNKFKKIYLCHEFNGIYDNAKKIVDYIDKLVSYDQNVIYISPILLFGNLYDILSTNLIDKYKLSILADCDIMMTFDDESDTEDCRIEKEYCSKHNIKIIKFTDFCKQNLGVDINEKK